MPGLFRLLIIGAACLLVPTLALSAELEPPDPCAIDLACDAATGELSWHYVNPGDFNQDGLVAVGDITTMHFVLGACWDCYTTTEAGGGDALAWVADANGNGLVEVGDITPLAANFDHGIDEYLVFTGAAADWPDQGELLAAVPFGAFTGDPRTERIRFQYQPAAPVAGNAYWVIPRYKGAADTPSPAVEYRPD